MSGLQSGGSYAVIDGELKQVEAPTQDHPEGNRPRDADGKPTDIPAPAPADPVGARLIAPEEAQQPARTRRGVPAIAAASGD